MKIFKDKKVIALAVILGLFTIVYFGLTIHASHAFVNGYNPNDSYLTLIDTIKKCSIAYAKKNPEIFNEENTAYIKVQDLIDNNFILSDEEGNIINPLNETSTLNSNIIKIKKDNKQILVEVDS